MKPVFLTLLCTFVFTAEILHPVAYCQDKAGINNNLGTVSESNRSRRVDRHLASHQKRITEQLKRTFPQLDNFIELDEAKKQAIAQALQGDIDQLAKQRTEMARAFVDHQLPIELQPRLLEELENQGCDPKSIKAYRQSYKKKHQFIEQLAKDSLIHFIDKHLILSPTQVQIIETITEEHWTPQLAFRAIVNDTNPKYTPKNLIDEIADHLPDEFLTPTQEVLMNSYHLHKDISVSSHFGPLLFNDDEKVKVDPNGLHRQWLYHSFDSKLNEIEDVCELSASQRAKLTVVKKKVIEQIFEQGKKLHKKLADGIGNRDRSKSDLHAIFFHLRSPIDSIQNTHRWNDTLPKTLNDTQLSKIKASGLERIRRDRRCRTGHAILTLSNALPNLRYGQQQQLQKLLVEELVSREPARSQLGGLGRYASYEIVLLLPEEVYKEILTDSQWDEFIPTLDLWIERNTHIMDELE